MNTLVEGACALATLGESTRRCRAGRVVLVVDEAVLGAGYVERVRVALDRADVTVDAVPPGEPTSASVDTVADVVRRADTPLVIGVGGGSALDTAKLAAAVAGADAPAERYALGRCRLPVGPPVVAIPTTAGTGAEVTRTCVFTSRDGRKLWAWGDELRPRLVVLDAVATSSMPASVTAATGLDAFVHAVEAVSGRRAGTFDDAPGRRAIRLVLDHLPRAVEHGDDLDARAAMQTAAMLAGRAIDGGGTAIAHAIGHALGTLGHVPHGVAVAVGLAAALEWNVSGAPTAYEPVAAAIGCPIGDLPGAYAELLGACRLADAVRGGGRLSVSVEALAAAMVAAENRPMHDNNCRLADDRDRHLLAERALAAWEELSRS